MVLDNPENLLGNLVHRQIALHRDQPSRALVVIHYRSSLLPVSRQSRLKHFEPVVIAGYQLRPVKVANFIDMGRLRVGRELSKSLSSSNASSHPA